MDDRYSTFAIFIICVSVLLGVCAFFGLLAYGIHEGNTPDPNKKAKIEACIHEEQVDVRALCLALVK